MKKYLGRNRWWLVRTGWLPIHIAFFATVAFFLVRLVPGDPVLARLDTSGGYTKAEYNAAAKSIGLDGSIWHQLGLFWSKLIQGNLGVSPVTGRPVWTELISRLPSTVELVTLGLVGSIVLSLALAMLQLRSSSPTVHKVLRGYGRIAGAVPDFAVAILGLVVLYTVLRVIPAPIGRVTPGIPTRTLTGFPLLDDVLTASWPALGSTLAHYALPVLVIIVVHTPNVWKQLTLGLQEQAPAPSTLFKIASGATRPAIYRSVLRRASASAVVMLGALFGGLIGGVVVLEQIFGFGGLGQFAINSVDNLDFLGLQGFLIVIAGIALIVYFLVDIVNMLLDPRRRPGVRVDA
ncbi:ABC transporter permease [Frondihabitans cladoniiphilus]|uniref:ABC transporter permease n=1 Tax=Frondihabitans cladoniiphilus TaxID=715785 RepID=A0ABP8VXS0_9MICO